MRRWKTNWYFKRSWAADYDPKKLPADLLTEFDKVAHLPSYKRAARKVLAGWRTWSKARDRYQGTKAPVTLIYGDHVWSRPHERERTRALIPQARMLTLKDTGHFSAVGAYHLG